MIIDPFSVYKPDFIQICENGFCDNANRRSKYQKFSKPSYAEPGNSKGLPEIRYLYQSDNVIFQICL